MPSSRAPPCNNHGFNIGSLPCQVANRMKEMQEALQNPAMQQQMQQMQQVMSNPNFMARMQQLRVSGISRCVTAGPHIFLCVYHIPGGRAMSVLKLKGLAAQSCSCPPPPPPPRAPPRTRLGECPMLLWGLLLGKSVGSTRACKVVAQRTPGAYSSSRACTSVL
jgi:hypothetical protein